MATNGRMGSHFGLRKFYYTLGDGSAVQLNFPGRARWPPPPICHPMARSGEDTPPPFGYSSTSVSRRDS